LFLQEISERLISENYVSTFAVSYVVITITNLYTIVPQMTKA
jgi:hypothetical protein